MDKKAWGLLSEDDDYRELLTGFVRTSEYGSRLFVKSFTSPDTLETYLREGGALDVLLADLELLPDPFPGIPVTVWLAETPPDEADDTNADKSTLFKYQPFHRLFETIFLSDSSHRAMQSGARIDSRAIVVSVYSAAGGCGKTTVASLLAKTLAEREYRVFYLNLESLPSGPVFASRSLPDSFRRAVYYAKSGDSAITDKLGTVIRFDEECQVHFFGCGGPLDEMSELGDREVKVLLDALKNSGRYDAVIVDLDSMPDKRAKTAWAESDRSVWLICDDLHVLEKTKAVLEETRRQPEHFRNSFGDRVRFLLNKYTGSVGNELLGCIPALAGKLPYVPEWKQVNRLNMWEEDREFIKQLWLFAKRELLPGGSGEGGASDGDGGSGVAASPGSTPVEFVSGYDG